MSNEKKASGRQSWLFLVATAAFVCLLGSAFTGTLLWLFIDKGPEGSKFLWGWHRHEWGDLHLDFSLAFVALAMIHFVQHWRWIRAAAPRQAGPAAGLRGTFRVAFAVIFTVGLVFGAFRLFQSGAQSYDQRDGEGYGKGRRAQERPYVDAEAETSDEDQTNSAAESVRRRYRGGRNN